MFKLFRGKLRSDAGPTQIEAHHSETGLAQRMEFRRDMLCQSIRETLKSIGVLGHMYKFKVSRIDERGHAFLVMIEIAQSFSIENSAKVDDFWQVESLIKHLTRERYGVVVHSIYWRIHESAMAFASQGRAHRTLLHEDSDESKLISAPKLTRRGQPSVGAHSSIQHSNTAFIDRVSEIEAAAFNEALKAGINTSIGHPNNARYVSDMAPLSVDQLRTGTEYGDLS